MNDSPGGCTSELDSVADRKSVAAQGDAQPRCQPFDSAPVTTAGPVPAADGIDWPTSGAGPVRQVSSQESAAASSLDAFSDWYNSREGVYGCVGEHLTAPVAELKAAFSAGVESVTLTDVEREAIEWACQFPTPARPALRALLERASKWTEDGRESDQ